MTTQTNILTDLNEAQRQAATSTSNRILCLAGAGSGKTRVLTHRAIHLITEGHRSPYDVLLMTFTNKAATEMKERIVAILGKEPRGMWIGTFHSICARIVRQWADRVGLESHFTIYDETDRHDILTYLIKNRHKCKVKPKTILAFMNESEGGGVDIGSADSEVISLIEEYYGFLKESNALDFHGILTFARNLLRDNADIQEYYHKRWPHILIDEYQDTNPIQDEIIQLINPHNLFVVGDDYQSIYKFRFADMRIMLGFQDRWPDAEVIKLTENYRSRPNIVRAANNLIAHNHEQLHKELKAMRESGEHETQVEFPNTTDAEAESIADDILEYHRADGDHQWDQVAVLARTHRQLDKIEFYLFHNEIPFNRIRSKDIWTSEPARICIAFLRVIRNPADNWSMGYILRKLVGLSQLQMVEVRSVRLNQSLTMYEAAKALEPDDPVVRFIDDSIRYTSGAPIIQYAPLIIQRLLEVVPVEEMYQKQHRDTKARQFQLIQNTLETWTMANAPENNYVDFLDWLSARQIQDQIEDSNKVTLATIHAAKGLEWEIVYLIGMFEGAMPHSRAETVEEIAEERRLCYVAITRAMNHLVMTVPATDLRGRAKDRSRFILEMKGELDD